MSKLKRSDKIAFILGAFAGMVVIKTQPDGNLLVTSVFTMGTGSIMLSLWVGLKKLSRL